MKSEKEIRKLKDAVRLLSDRHGFHCKCDCPSCLVKGTALTILEWALDECGSEGDRFAETVLNDAAAGK